MKLASVCLVACWCLMALTKAAEVDAAAAVEVEDGVDEELLLIDDRDDAAPEDVEQEAVDLAEDRIWCRPRYYPQSRGCKSRRCKNRCDRDCKKGGRYRCKNSTQSNICRRDCKRSLTTWQKYRCAKTMCKYKKDYDWKWRKYNG